MLCLPPFFKLKLENNSIQKLIFWSDNFYSMFVPSLPSLYQGPLTRRGYTDTVSTDTTQVETQDTCSFTLAFYIFRVHRVAGGGYCFNKRGHQSARDKPRRIISLREMFGGSPRDNQVKIQSPEMKD